MDKAFIDILQKLIAEKGKEALFNASKYKGLLADYTKNEYKRESRWLLNALDAGVQKAIDTTKELAICKKQQVRMLHEDYSLDEKVAADVVDTLALVLKGDTSVTEIQSSNNVLGVNKPAKKTPSTATGTAAAPGIESLMKRGNLFLEDADWKQADEYFDRVLDIDPEYAPAYAGKLCAELKVRQEDQLAQNKEPLTGYNHFKKAIRFADVDYREKLEQYNKAIKDCIAKEERLEQKRVQKEKERIAEEERQKRERERREQERIRIAEKAKAEREQREEFEIYKYFIAAGGFYTVMRYGGTVVAVGDNEKGQCNVSGWRGILAVAAGERHTVGLKEDDTDFTVVVAVGDNGHGQCNVSGWRDIVAVAAGECHTVGLKGDVTVVAVGDNGHGQCNVSGWRIVAVTAGSSHTVGLKADGTVVAVGNNGHGQCNVSGWRDIVAVTAGSSHTVGLKADGTVVAIGKNDDGQCNVSGWRDIGAVAAGSSHTVGLKTDFTVVVAVGDNGHGQCNVSNLEQKQQWQQQGLCKYCGGKLSLFGRKCKSCGGEN